MSKPDKARRAGRPGPNPEKAEKFLGRARQSLALAAEDAAQARDRLSAAQTYLKWARKYADESRQAAVGQVQADIDQALRLLGPAEEPARRARRKSAPSADPNFRPKHLRPKGGGPAGALPPTGKPDASAAASAPEAGPANED